MGFTNPKEVASHQAIKNKAINPMPALKYAMGEIPDRRSSRRRFRL
jgi:hypothetical protein